MARIVLNTFGSLGDLHPYLAIAIALKGRGHEAVIATSEVYRKKITDEGVGFFPVRPDVGERVEDTAFLKKVWDPKRGSEFLIREYLLPSLEDSYNDLSCACEGADLLVTHSAAYAGPIVAGVQRLPWISIALQPAMFASLTDPPVLGPAPWLYRVHKKSPLLYKILFNTAKKKVAWWAKPIQHLRRKVGLPPTQGNPIFEAQFSPFGTLALFSRHFGPPQPDWPADVHCVGFPFYDRESTNSGTTQELTRFLAEGPPPVVFTLGSSAVMQAGSFYRESFEAARQLGIRAVFLVGRDRKQDLPNEGSENLHVDAYAPYSELLPKAAAVVHQGGIGTTAQTLRAGVPMIVVPWSHDQPDNGNRVAKLGSGLVIPRKQYTPTRAAEDLAMLLRDQNYSDSARTIAEKIRKEDAIGDACARLESVLHANS